MSAVHGADQGFYSSLAEIPAVLLNTVYNTNQWDIFLYY